MTLMVEPPALVLRDDCPIAWPNLTPVPADTTKTTTSLVPIRHSIDWVRTRYERTLYLPEPLAPIEQLAKDLFLLSSASSFSASSSTSTSSLNPLTLTLPQIEQKHRRRLSPLLLRYLSNPSNSSSSSSAYDHTTSPNTGTSDLGESFLDETEKKIWREGIGYRLDVGVGGLGLGLSRGEGGGEAINPGDKDGVEDDEEKEKAREREKAVGRVRKRLTDEFERREVMVQIILLLLILLHNPPPSTTKTKRKKPRPPKPKSSSTSISTSTPNPSLDPLGALDVLSDRLSVWQAIGGNGVSLYTEPDLLAWINGKKSIPHLASATGSGGEMNSGEEEEDWVKRFWTGVLWKSFGNVKGPGEDQVRGFLKGMYRKIFGVDFVQVSNGTGGVSGSNGKEMSEVGGQSEVIETKERKGMRRESSVISTTGGSATLGVVPARPGMIPPSSTSRRSSMESTTSHRMSFSRDPTPSVSSRATAGAGTSMGPPLPGSRRVSGHTPTPSSALELDDSELELDTRKGGLRRTTSRVNSGVDIFKGREVGFTRTNSFKPVAVEVAGSVGGPGPGGSSSQTGATSMSLGRTSSAMAGMNVILGKRKTMIVPKDKTGPAVTGSFVKPSDPVQDKNRQAGGLQKSFSTSTLAMATPSKPRMESRLSGPESQPSSFTQFAPLSAFVAETPSNSVIRRQVAEDRFASNKASLEGTRQVLFPSAGQGETTAGRPEDQNLADFMEDTDDEDDASSFFTSGKRRRLDSNVKETARHVVLFRNPHAEAKQDNYLQILSATKKFRPKCCPVLGQVFIDQEGLVEVIKNESDKWSGLIATSKRAGEAWAAACKAAQRESTATANSMDWSRVPLYTPGPATGASFTCQGLPLNMTPRRVEASEETGSAIPLGQFIVEYHASFAPDAALPILILEGDKNGPNLTDTIKDHVTFFTRETYATGPREDLAVDVKQICQSLMSELDSTAAEKTMWLVFFAPSSARAILDCIETTEYAAGLPFAKQVPLKGVLQFRLAAVGNTTAMYLRDRGFDVDAVAKQPTAEGVRDALLEAE